ncbi:MAG TPA: DUF721 domain-containing protein [Syntrophales bacterium]|nr:DUF721 domain-containing protein [Syntrophales bacterium]
MARRGRQKSLQHLGDVLAAALRKRRIFLNLPDRRLATSWTRAVGHVIAAQTRIDRRSGDTLYVKVSGPAWMHQLHFLREEILAKLNRDSSDPPLNNLRFFIGDVGPAPAANTARPSERSAAAPLRERDRRMIEESLDPVSDAELKEVLRRVMTREIGRRRALERKPR